MVLEIFSDQLPCGDQCRLQLFRILVVILRLGLLAGLGRFLHLIRLRDVRLAFRAGRGMRLSEAAMMADQGAAKSSAAAAVPARSAAPRMSEFARN